MSSRVVRGRMWKKKSLLENGEIIMNGCVAKIYVAIKIKLEKAPHQCRSGTRRLHQHFLHFSSSIRRSREKEIHRFLCLRYAILNFR